MKINRTLLFLLLLASTSVCLAQSPGSPNSTASSRINVRIPSYAIITLADNNSKNVSYTTANSKKAELSQSKVMSDVISNTKWSVTVSREESSPNAFSSSNNPSRIKDAPMKESSVTMIYVTSMN